jgi:hypothetical protein
MVESELGGHFSSLNYYADQAQADSTFGGDAGAGAMAPDAGLGGGSLDSPDSLSDDSTNMGSGLTAHLHYQGVAGKEDTGYFNPNSASPEDWDAGSGDEFANQVSQSSDEIGNSVNPMGDSGGGGAAEGEAGGAAEGGGAAELAVLANLHQKDAGFDPVAAFDAGGFDASAVDGGGGELRRAGRVGSGPRSQVRIDPGFRGGGQARQAAAAPPPEDFGYDGGREFESYLQETNDPSGADIVANFHRQGAGVLSDAGASRPGSTDDFSSSPMVQAMLRTAGRNYSPEEQRELEGEFHPMGARNGPTPDDLAGTHYVM